jgi:uncharacterized tellurite resistance protein B-like protein
VIIFGTQPSTSTVSSGTFFCPECQSESSYRQRRVNQNFSLFFVPVLPLSEVAQYIECQRCGGTFKPEVLNYRPAPSSKDFEAEYKRAIRLVMVLMMTTDGLFRPSEVAAIRGAYHHLTGIELTEEQIRSEAQEFWKQDKLVLKYLGNVGAYLNESGKEQVLRAAIFVAGADDQLAKDEMKLVSQIGGALKMTPTHIRAVFQDMTSSIAKSPSHR